MDSAPCRRIVPPLDRVPPRVSALPLRSTDALLAICRFLQLVPAANWGYVEELVAAMTAVSPAPGGPYGDQLVAVVQLVVLPTHVYVVDS